MTPFPHRPINALRMICILGLVTLAGCASKVPLDDKQDAAAAPVVPAAGASAAGSAPSPQDSAAATVTREIAAARAELARVRPSIYFDYDRFEIRAEYQPVISAYANYLKVDANARLIIEGNADERGTTEYNLALGQKRAQAVARALEVMGVRPGRVEAISNGEEKPKALGSNEAAWAENRRADLLLK
jgi:peptidoglycan-associated lipoprotein